MGGVTRGCSQFSHWMGPLTTLLSCLGHPSLPATPLRLQPQQLYGETGAQSAILHSLDAALGIQHDACSWLRAYLLDMRAHM